MRHFNILLLLSTLSIYCSAQKDSSAYKMRFAVYTDIILDALNEKNIGAEVKISPRIALGASYGRVLPSLYYGEHFLIASHDKFPGRIYEGYVLKTNLKYYFQKDEKFYLQTSFQYKTLRYDSADFSDGGDGRGVYFSRANEKAWLLGGDILLGIDFIVMKHIYFDVFFGLGYRFRRRSYTTYKNAYAQYNSYNPPPPLGDYIVHQNYIAPILGVKIGGCFTKK
jgi:hypothetical protein